ncbi:transposase [Sphingosinicella sp.]|uniref:transposase n=1 Tax=Sphingosinicella sp. TaxID=1917971 RepID=UPI0035B04FF7
MIWQHTALCSVPNFGQKHAHQKGAIKILYKRRNRAERMFGHLKINHAIATRYDQLAKASSA